MEKPNNDKIIKHIKNLCKQMKKLKHYSDIPLMKIQHNVSVFLGFKKWSDLLDNIEKINLLQHFYSLEKLVFNMKIFEEINKEKKS